MRVGLLVYALDRPLSGISRYAVELVRAMSSLDNAPEIVLFAAGGVGPLEGLGLPTVSLRGCARLPALLTVGNALLAAAGRSCRLDVVHDTTGVTPFAMGGGGSTRVVTVHDVIPLSFAGVSTTLDRLIYQRWLPRILPRVEHVITDSECSRADIARFFDVPYSRITPIPLAANPNFAPSTEDQIARVRSSYSLPERYLLYLGSVEERKNVSRVFEALARLAESGFNLPLVVTGEMKWQYEGVLQALDRHGMRESVQFTGYVSDEDLPALYSGAMALVFPSLYEGFGLPVLEAMASGTPVITSTVSSLPEVAGDAALKVDPLDVDALAQAMRRISEDEALRRSLRAAGLSRAAEFSWQRTAQRTVDLYRSLV